MTVEELKALNLPIKASDKVCLYIGAGVEWVNEHTTLYIGYSDTSEMGTAVLNIAVLGTDGVVKNINALPDGVKLFLSRYYDVMSTDGNVTSESIGGMSQSFGTTSKAAQLYQLASELMGKYLKGQISSVPNVSKWV